MTVHFRRIGDSRPTRGAVSIPGTIHYHRYKLVVICVSYQWLSFRVDFRAMERMAGYNFYIRREMLLERGQLWGLARGLATDNRTDLGSCVNRSDTARK